MTKRELINLCLALPFVYEDYPFDEIAAVMRHSGNKKMFALIAHRHDRLYINLKCDPLEADFLRKAFKDVEPGWHMNKTHWNTVYVDGDVHFQELQRMVQCSYDLIAPKARIP
ncbi:MAG: MmcQ/YjbR family DNA-binding protein [Oscillospiraceae bacterium]|nr:MmcQ/YjbR family DNA-binding protein [Oscillospiraceae bacterium]